VLAAAARAGYASIATSRPGLNRRVRPQALARLVVRAGDAPERVLRLARGDGPTVAQAIITVGALDAAKWLLGNRRYGAARALWRRLLDY